MMEMGEWIRQFLQALHACFGDRLWFAGLQGSQARGEATAQSDIDVVVILDMLSAEDIRIYGGLLDGLPDRERVCGFLSGREELLHWEASDLFQFYHDTKPLFGSLDALLPRVGPEAACRAVETGVCNLYHGCVHNLLHEKSEEVLRGLYKSAGFVVQAICFLQTGDYISRLQDLLQRVGPRERPIVQTALQLKKGGPVDFEGMSAELFAWAQSWIGRQAVALQGASCFKSR